MTFGVIGSKYFSTRGFKNKEDAEKYMDLIQKIFPDVSVRIKEHCSSHYRRVDCSKDNAIEDAIFKTMIWRCKEDFIKKISEISGFNISFHAKNGLRDTIRAIAESIKDVGPSVYAQCVNPNRTGASRSGYSLYCSTSADIRCLYKDIGYLNDLVHECGNRQSTSSLYKKLYQLGVVTYNRLYESISVLYFPMEEYVLPPGAELTGKQIQRIDEDTITVKFRDTEFAHKYDMYKLSSDWILCNVHGEKGGVTKIVYDINTGQKLHASGQLAYTFRNTTLEIPFKRIQAGTQFWIQDGYVASYKFKKNNVVDFSHLSSTVDVTLKDVSYRIDDNLILWLQKCDGKYNDYPIHLKINKPVLVKPVLVPVNGEYILPSPEIPSPFIVNTIQPFTASAIAYRFPVYGGTNGLRYST